jgi:hypothetical protein
MEINSERHFDAESKALYDEGIDVSYGGESLSFAEAGRTLIYDIDDLSPDSAALRKEVVAGESRQARISPVNPNCGAFQVTKDDQLFVKTLRFLDTQRSVKYISLYNGPTGGYKRVMVSDFF